ncbi:MAG: hypothetical protein M1435_00120, partial [Actinobacteria bacterium]|nr:hypothetical protein [Actinomycetota bacterium]
GSAGFRKEVNSERAQLRVLGATIFVGAVAGGVLLLTTPSHDFAVLAPYLLLAACALFAVQPLLAARLRRRGKQEFLARGEGHRPFKGSGTRAKGP